MNVTSLFVLAISVVLSTATNVNVTYHEGSHVADAINNGGLGRELKSHSSSYSSTKAFKLKSKESKLSKKEKKSKKGNKTIKSLEGQYVYAGCQNNIFFVNITCGYIEHDPDLCKFEEFKIGSASKVEEEGATPIENGFFTPESYVEEEEVVDGENVCILENTFRASSTVQGREFLPIPLASSNGCKKVSKNFEFVVKGRMIEDGNLDLSFSDNGGKTYHTDDIVCPTAYQAKKIEMDTTTRTLMEHRSRKLFLWFIPIIIPILPPVVDCLLGGCDFSCPNDPNLGNLCGPCIPGSCECSHPNLKCVVEDSLPDPGILNQLTGFSAVNELAKAFGLLAGICVPDLSRDLSRSPLVNDLKRVLSSNRDGIGEREKDVFGAVFQRIAVLVEGRLANDYPFLPLRDRRLPRGWNCDQRHFATGDGCHCNCGAIDYDCYDQSQQVIGCSGSCINAQGDCDFSRFLEGESSQTRHDFELEEISIVDESTDLGVDQNNRRTGDCNSIKPGVSFYAGTEIFEAQAIGKVAVMAGAFLDTNLQFGLLDCACLGAGLGFTLGVLTMVAGFQFPILDQLSGTSYVIDADFVGDVGVAIGVNSDLSAYNLEFSFGLLGGGLNLASWSQCDCHTSDIGPL